jgi:putative serine protease PepD
MVWRTVCAVLLALSNTNWPTAVKPAIGAVVRLEMQRESGKGLCSAVLVNADAGFALTMAHCTGTDPKGLSMTANGRHAELIRWNELLDLAVVRFDVKGETQIPLAKETPVAGTEIAVLGFAYGSRQLHTQYGHVSLPLDEESQRLMLDATVIFGDSGGMAINAAGELVGMTSAIKTAGGSLAVMLPVESVRDFAKAYLPKPKTP